MIPFCSFTCNPGSRLSRDRNQDKMYDHQTGGQFVGKKGKNMREERRGKKDEDKERES